MRTIGSVVRRDARMHSSAWSRKERADVSTTFLFPPIFQLSTSERIAGKSQSATIHRNIHRCRSFSACSTRRRFLNTLCPYSGRSGDQGGRPGFPYLIKCLPKSSRPRTSPMHKIDDVDDCYKDHQCASRDQSPFEGAHTTDERWFVSSHVSPPSYSIEWRFVAARGTGARLSNALGSVGQSSLREYWSLNIDI
jgi:hypothetical protein